MSSGAASSTIERLVGWGVLVGFLVDGAVGAVVAVGRGGFVGVEVLAGAGVMVGSGSGVLSCAVQAAKRKVRITRAIFFMVFVYDFISIGIGLQ